VPLPPLTGDPGKDLPPLTGDPTKDLGSAPPPAVPPTPPVSREDLVTRALRSGAPGYIGAPAAVFLTPGGAQAAKETARVTLPIAAGAATGGLSLPLQALAQMATTGGMQAAGLEEKNPANVVASGALPFGMAGLGRVVRGLGRTATRMLPGRFLGAQQATQAGAEEVAKGLEPQANVGALFKGAKAVAAEAVPTPKLQAMLDDLDIDVGKNPTSPGLKAARELMDTARGYVKDGEASLGDLMKLRIDTGQSAAKSPQVAALNKAILGDLEQAGAVGGPGAQLAQQALVAARSARGAEMLREMIAKSSKGRSALTGEQPLLNMSHLSREVEQNKDKLIQMVGPQGVAKIEEFLANNRALPPTHAYTAANGLVSYLGFTGGGIPAMASWELLKNAYAVGKNPMEMNRAMIMLGEGARAYGAGGLAKDAVEAKK
jgi:hypothetical protein